jgi:cytochrome c553
MKSGWGACVVAGAVALCLAGAVAHAGDAAKGEALAKGCSCHKAKGDLNGRSEADLMAKMQAYKAGQGPNKAMITIMQKVADADLPDLAAYYAGLAAVKK